MDGPILKVFNCAFGQTSCAFASFFFFHSTHATPQLENDLKNIKYLNKKNAKETSKGKDRRPTLTMPSQSFNVYIDTNKNKRAYP